MNDISVNHQIAKSQGITIEQFSDDIIKLTGEVKSFTKAVEIQRERLLKNERTLSDLEKG